MSNPPSHCQIHDSYPSDGEPCWGCVNPYLTKLEAAKEALGFYADPANREVWFDELYYAHPSRIMTDKGKRARKVLEEIKQ